MEENIVFQLTSDKVEKVCNHFGEDYEIYEYLDKIIAKL